LCSSNGSTAAQEPELTDPEGKEISILFLFNEVGFCSGFGSIFDDAGCLCTASKAHDLRSILIVCNVED